MAQSYGRWGGRALARSLQKTSSRSWYSGGMPAVSGRAGEQAGADAGAGAGADRRHWAWQEELQLETAPDVQSIRGLCNWSQGWPRTMGVCGELMTWRVMVSEWLPDSSRVRGAVQRSTRAKGMPLSALASSGWVSGLVRMPICRTRVESMKLSSAPESIRARTSQLWPDQESLPWSWVHGRRAEEVLVQLIRTSPTTDEPRPFGRTGHETRMCPSWPQYKQLPVTQRRCHSWGVRCALPSCIGSGSEDSASRGMEKCTGSVVEEGDEPEGWCLGGGGGIGRSGGGPGQRSRARSARRWSTRMARVINASRSGGNSVAISWSLIFSASPA